MTYSFREPPDLDDRTPAERECERIADELDAANEEIAARDRLLDLRDVEIAALHQSNAELSAALEALLSARIDGDVTKVSAAERRAKRVLAACGERADVAIAEGGHG